MAIRDHVGLVLDHFEDLLTLAIRNNYLPFICFDPFISA